MPRTIEEYLTDVCDHLRGLPAKRQYDALREVENHLRSSAEEHGGGIEGEYAAAAAYGEPKVIARELMAAGRPTDKFGIAALIVAALIPVGLMVSIVQLAPQGEELIKVVIWYGCVIGIIFGGLSALHGRVLVRPLLAVTILMMLIMPTVQGLLSYHWLSELFSWGIDLLWFGALLLLNFVSVGVGHFVRRLSHRRLAGD